MAVKMIAVDMDGTFLNRQMDYDRPRFHQQYAQLQQRGIKFVVASGNQYYQLASYFPQIASQIAFVAENGAYIVDQGDEIYSSQLAAQHYGKVIDTLAQFPYAEVIVCCAQGAYLLDSASEDFFNDLSRYYLRLQAIADFSLVPYPAFKFAVTVPNELLATFMAEIGQQLAGILVPVSSGHGSVDLILPGNHKGHGLRLLQKKWGIADSEVLAFGDGGNDIEMLQQAGFGFAMENAPQAIKDIAAYRAPGNDEAGVLIVIDQMLARADPFN